MFPSKLPTLSVTLNIVNILPPFRLTSTGSSSHTNVSSLPFAPALLFKANTPFAGGNGMVDGYSLIGDDKAPSPFALIADT